ncbi:MAG: TetR family transcriptional regulator [Rhodoferax sp.]|uniref:TetR family transcriptional regulator n=1 Tax=Rhodoferax sp. TaxID=50421 RepID=UPI0027216A2C|nr:TetR family transcriptional regulator [Rhodoferax sp.]MDO8447212.1 TetR family transcriptional regulator [Rhodoferax sp.]
MPIAPKKLVSKQRARSQADKDVRRTQLTEAATRLFAHASFEAVTIARVAEAAGVAKGTAYIYFATKEALFLELVRAELTQWLDSLTLTLKRLRSTQPARAVPNAVARSLAERPVLRRLLVLLHTVIEPNIDEASARNFKLFLRDLLTEAGAAIAPKIPGLSLEDAMTLVLQTHALVISITQLADPPPVIARVIAADASLQSMCLDFEPFLADTLRTLVRGTLGKM